MSRNIVFELGGKKFTHTCGKFSILDFFGSHQKIECVGSLYCVLFMNTRVFQQVTVLTTTTITINNNNNNNNKKRICLVILSRTVVEQNFYDLCVPLFTCKVKWCPIFPRTINIINVRTVIKPGNYTHSMYVISR